MPFPLIAAGLLAGSATVSAGAKFYTQAKQRELYNYQKAGYERYVRNWQKANPGRRMRYPELNAPGHIRALDTGISQSYAGTVGTASNLVGNYSAGYGYARSSGLFGKVPSRTSRWL